MLAGGRSTRFGGEDKLGADVGGAPLLHRPILALAEVASDVVVVLAPGAAAPPMPPGVGPRITHDATEGAGPLAGTLAGLQAADTELAIVVGGDMPSLVPAVLHELIRAVTDRGVDAAALHETGRVRPLPIALRVAPAAAAARALLGGGERRLRALTEALATAAVEEATWRALDPDGETLVDIDEPADLPGPGR